MMRRVNLPKKQFKCEFMGEDLRIGVRYDYILQSLQHINEEIANDDMIELLFNGLKKHILFAKKKKWMNF